MKKYFRDKWKMVSWFFMLLSLAYLMWTVYTHHSLDELMHSLENIPLNRSVWLILVVVLLPLNLLLEGLKWKKTLRHTEKINTTKAFKSVVTGMASGFVTPNRVGDIFGRIVYLQHENRKAGLGLATITSLTKNLAILIPGIPAACIFFLSPGAPRIISLPMLVSIYISFLLLILLALLFLPGITTRIKHPGIVRYLSGIQNFSSSELLGITLISMLRVLVFSLQLWFILQFFGVNPGLTGALTAIPANWLFVTFTPSIAISEGFVRTSWAMFFIGHFAGFHPGILLAGFTLWLINVIIPVLVGNVLLMKKK